MPSLQDLLSNALVSRLRQNTQATQAGQLGGRDVGDIPVLGGLMTAGGNNNGLSAVNALNALGLFNEGAGNIGKALGGVLSGGLVGSQQAGYYALHPNETPSAGDQAYIDAFNALKAGHPIGANEAAAREHPILQGATDLLTNPLNFTGPIGEAGQALEAAGNLPALAQALKGAGYAGEVANRAPLAPLAVIPAVRRALLASPEFLRAGEQVAPAVAADAAQLAQAGARQTAAREALTTVSERGNVPSRQLVPGIGQGWGLGPALPPEVGPLLPPELGPRFPERGNAPPGSRFGPHLLPSQDIPLPPELGPALPGRGNVPKDQLVPGVGRNGGKGIGPLLPPPLGPPVPDVPKAVQPLADLLGAAQRSAQPNPLEQLVDAAQRTAAREVAPRQTLAQIEAAIPKASEVGQLPLPEVDAASTPITPPALDFTDRSGTIKAVANGPLDHLTNVLRDLHNAVYPNGQSDFAIPALTGQAKQAFRTSFLTDHPGGNAAEPYLDYMVSRVQKDPKAAARLSMINPMLADDVNMVAESPLPLTEHKRLVQALFGVGPEGAEAAQAATATVPTDPLGAMRDLITSGDGGNMGGYAPSNADFYAKRLGLAPDDVPGMLDQLVQEGTLGKLPDGSLGIKPKPALGGDIAAGGGGFDTLGAVAPRLAQTLGGAALGGAVGGLAGATQGYNIQDHLENAAFGAGVGAVAGGSLGSASPEITQLAQHVLTNVPALGKLPIDPSFFAEALEHGASEQAAAKTAPKARGLGQVLGAMDRQGRQQIVNTFKQLPQDALQRLVTNWGIAGKEFGTTRGDFLRWEGILRGERKVGGASSLTDPLISRFRALGQQKLLGELPDTYGIDYATSIAGQGEKQLGPVGRTVTGALTSSANPIHAINPLAYVYGGVRGYFAPFVNGAIGYMNSIQHDAFRYALAEKALDRDIPQVASAFLDKLEQGGADVSALRPTGGFFSPTEVAAVAGDQAAKEWDGLTTTLIKAQGDRIATLGGDFRDKSAGALEKGIGKAIPFSRWAIRNAPVLAEIAANHPRAAAVIGGVLAEGAKQARDAKLKNYQAGTIPLTDKTPLVGGLVRARLGGQAGTVRVDPLGALLPFGSDTLLGPDLGGDSATAYQKATGLLGMTGFQPHPGIQALAYALGQDYKGPSAMSRTAGLEALPNLIPGMPQVPTLGVPLDMARSAIEPALNKAGVPTAGKTSEYDPVFRHYDELVLAQTGKSLDDPSNRQLLISAGDPSNPLWVQAQREATLAGAAGNLTSITSPVSTQAQGAGAQAVQQAKAGTPYSQAQIAGSSPGVAALMKTGNDRYQAATPATGTYKIASQSDRLATLLAAFDKSHATLKRLNPTAYYQQRDKYVAGLH